MPKTTTTATSTIENTIHGNQAAVSQLKKTTVSRRFTKKSVTTKSKAVDAHDEDQAEQVESNDAPIAIDDPVRMYLMQMGEIPLLTRDEEIASAKKIEETRTRFRNWMLATDFVLQAAVTSLEKVRDGELRLDLSLIHI